MISEFVILLKQERQWRPFDTLRRDPMLRAEVCEEEEEKSLFTEAQRKIWRAPSSGITLLCRYSIL